MCIMGPNGLNLAVSILKEPILPMRLAYHWVYCNTRTGCILDDIGTSKKKRTLFTHYMMKLTSSFYV